MSSHIVTLTEGLLPMSRGFGAIQRQIIAVLKEEAEKGASMMHRFFHPQTHLRRHGHALPAGQLPARHAAASRPAARSFETQSRSHYSIEQQRIGPSDLSDAEPANTEAIATLIAGAVASAIKYLARKHYR